MTGQTVECSLDQLYFRKEPDIANESQAWMIRDPDGYWKGNLIQKPNGEAGPELKGIDSKLVARPEKV